MMPRLLALLLLPLSLLAGAQEVRLAVGLAKPPYVEDGGRRGLEAELALAALRAAGHQVEVVQVPQARGLVLLKEGLVDAMLTLVPGASSGLFYSQPLLYYRNRAIVRKDSGIVLQQQADLARYSVASFQNARLLFGAEYAAAVARSPLYAEYADQDIQNRLLFNRRVDVIVGDERIFRTNPSQRDRDGQSHDIVTFALFGDSPRHVGFRNELLRRDFDTALQTLKRNGEYERIHRYYRDKYQLPQ